MTLIERPQRACAWHGDRLIADSTGAVRLEQPDLAPVLWFPRADVSTEVLEDPACTPTDGVDRLSGFVTFAAADVRIELVDGDSTVRFPNWGSAAHLIDMMDVKSVGHGRFRSVTRSDWRRPVVEASQMLGQVIVAAMRSTGGRRVVSASMVFVRGADSREPLTFNLDELSNGRTFTAFTATVEQFDRLSASGTLLLDATAPPVICHSVPMPDVPGPLECPSYDMGVTGRDLRIVDGAYTGDPFAPVGPPRLDAWVRFRDVPDDPALHAGLLAQFTGHLSIAAALRAHAGVGERQAHVSLSMGINAISISFHRAVRADQWMLYTHHSTAAGDGMTHSECRVHDEAGTMLASFTVDAMLRAFGGTSSGDYRSSM